MSKSTSPQDIQLQENATKPRKKAKLITTIPEDETTAVAVSLAPTFSIEMEPKNSKLNRKASDASRISTVSNKSNPKASFTFDNKAFEGNFKNNSGNDSIRTSRAPSLRSLEVHKEQYCCCSRRTQCERFLLVAVTVLTIIVLVLLSVIIVLAKQNKLKFIH